MAKLSSFSTYILIFIITRLLSILAKLRPWNNISLVYEQELFPPHTTRLHFDPWTIQTASTDFGNIINQNPAAVLRPTSVTDIIDIVKFSYESSIPFSIAARGHGHSFRGQATACNGVVMDMSSLGKSNETRIKVFWNPSLGYYGDVGGEQLWIDVLRTTLDHGLAPVSWTDYLYLTVGGTLSNAGISGQSFLHGPQISNVHELDVVTGRGELLTCSKNINSELFYAVLGGLGQFGIITRARIRLEKAPTRVKWVRMVYEDFSTFTKDQLEFLISSHGLDYVEGSLILQPSNWRSSFFPSSHQSKIAPLLNRKGILYSLEVVKYYDELNADSAEKELAFLLERLNYIQDFIFKKDVTLVDFLNRVRSGELNLRAKGLWEVPHPWLNLFVPKSGIEDFNSGVFINILARKNTTAGPVLVYPITKNKWDNRTSAVIPNEEIFYAVGLLYSGSETEDWETLDEQNREILEFCEGSGIEIKQYLPHYKKKEEWKKHFGPKWNIFQERKSVFDPRLILGPGQRIFNSFQEKRVFSFAGNALSNQRCR